MALHALYSEAVQLCACGQIHSFAVLSVRSMTLKYTVQTVMCAVPGTIWAHGARSSLLAVCLALAAD